MDAASLTAPAPSALKFAPSSDFHAALKEAVGAYFASTGLSTKGGPRLYVKAATIFAWAVASYAVLVFAPLTWWQAVAPALSLGLAIAAIGFNVQHDGNHGAFSRWRFLNQLSGLSIDLLGGSSYLWRHKHNVLHHTYTNFSGWDEDISLAPLGRLSPHQKLRSFHRFQHLYLWPFYGFIAMKWQLFDDYRSLARGTMGGKHYPRPRGWDLALLISTKLLSFGVAFVVPSFFHPVGVVLCYYFLTLWTTGIVLSVVFQLAHCVEEARHPAVPESPVTANEWARHQVETSVDFARGSRLITWYVGGLNMQIEHHLFPKVAHVHYPALAQIVEGVCARFAVEHRSHPSLSGALASHYRFLRRVGRGEPLAS